MLFSSITFLIYFLPCMVLVYFLAPGRMKNTVLLLGSLIFYGWGEPKYLPVMAAVILAGYLSARLIGTCQNKRQSKILLAAAVLLEIFRSSIANMPIFYPESQCADRAENSTA